MRRVDRRVILPAVGLVVAVAVGWPLGWPVFGTVLGFTWLPLMAWATLAAGRPWFVGAGLVGAIASVRLVLPGGPGDRTLGVVLPVLALYLVVESAAVLVVAWRLPFPAGSTRRQVALGLTPVLLAGCCVGGFVATLPDAPVPSRSELLPLPAPLRLVGSIESGCGPTHTWCYQAFRVGGSPGMGRDGVKPLLTRHLATTKGWDRGSAAEGGCRRAGTVRLPMTICLTFDEASDPGAPPDAVDVTVGVSKPGWGQRRVSDQG
jgi:hypothetical protein